MTANLVSMVATLRARGNCDIVPAAVRANLIQTGYAAVAADTATLVTDGATPTQAHVTTLAADWAILKALIDAQVTAGANSVTLVFDAAVFSDTGKLAIAFKEFLERVKGTGYLTS